MLSLNQCEKQMQTEEEDFFIIAEKETGERLDKILAGRFEGKYSRTYFQYLIEEGYVLLNGTPVKKRIKSKAGDEVEIHFAVTPEIQLTPEPIPLSIVYEDEGMLIIDKPAGLIVHPAPGHWSGTLVNALLYYCGQLPSNENNLRPGIVHRIDKDTSGLLITAKTTEMHRALTRLFAQREIDKEYLAVCIGTPPEGEISAPIGRHPIHRKQMAVVENGRPATGHFTVLGKNERLSAVRAVITTGRTHQIRVHLKHLGFPILGDSLYGNSSVNLLYGAKRQLLHASLLRFIHPLTGEKLEFRAPLPEDMAKFFKKLVPHLSS